MYENGQANTGQQTASASITTGTSGTASVGFPFAAAPLSAQRERAPLDAVLNELQTQIENVQRLVAAVDARFSPVLAPIGPPTGASGAVNQPVPVMSPVRGLIGDRVSQLRDTAAFLESILHRCEL